MFIYKTRVQKAAYIVLEKLETFNESILLISINNKTYIENNQDKLSTILARQKVDTMA